MGERNQDRALGHLRAEEGVTFWIQRSVRQLWNFDPAARQQFLEGASVHRLGEVIALRVVAAQVLEVFHLFGRLGALRHLQL